MSLGFVIGEAMPTLVTAQTSRSLPIGEYVIIDSAEGKIIGLAEKSVVSSASVSRSLYCICSSVPFILCVSLRDKC